MAVLLEDRPACHRLGSIEVAEGTAAIAPDQRLLAIAKRHTGLVAMRPGVLKRPFGKNEEVPAIEEPRA